MTNKKTNEKYEINFSMDYKQEQVWFPLSEDILGWDNDFHELMLNDSIRMIAYKQAVKEVVKPGMTVLDLGTGTGILSLWALEAGAKKVYGIEINKKVIPVALKRIEEAGFLDRFEIFNDISYNVNLPEKVDIIISEILGNLADNEDMVPILDDAKNRFLKGRGAMLPKKIRTYLVPISSEKAHSQVRNKSCRAINGSYSLNDILLRLGVKSQFDLYYDAIIPKKSYLSRPKLVKRFKFDGTDKKEYQIKKVFNVEKKGVFTGFKGYFVAELSDNVILDISGDDIKNRKTADCWKHCYLPVEEPFEVQANDKIELVYSRDYPKERNSPFRQRYSWSGCVIRSGKVIYKFKQEMKGGKC